MKNATKHAESLKSLLKQLLKEHKPEPRTPLEPVPALVKGAMSYDVPDSRVEDAMKVIEKEFVDLNELRVATDLEAQEMLGPRYPDIERRVSMITLSLNNIFEREHTLNLERLKTVGKKDARQFLKELPDVHPFVEAYVMLHAFDGAAFPIDETTLAYLLEHGVVEEGATLSDAQKFVEGHLKAEEVYDFYAAVRRAVFDDGKRKRAK